MEIRDLLSRPVLSLYEGEMLGTVCGVMFDRKLKNMTGIEFATDDDIHYVVLAKNIYHVGKNAITIKNNEYAILRDNLEPLPDVGDPTGSKVYSITGELKGVIQSVDLGAKYEVTKISLDNGTEVDLTRLANCSKNTVLVYDEHTTVNINKFRLPKPKFFKSRKDQNVSTLPVMSEPEPVAQSPIAVYTPTDISLPNKGVTNSSFIIGRRVTKEIFGLNNDIIIKKNTKITQNTINTATKFGKLKELMMYCE